MITIINLIFKILYNIKNVKINYGFNFKIDIKILVNCILNLL